MKLLFLSIILFSYTSAYAQNKKKDVKKFQDFALECEPIYQNKTDTFHLAAIPVPPKKLNQFLLNIEKTDNEFNEVGEYAFLIMMKVLLERLTKSRTAYFLLNEHNLYENGVEKICLMETNFSKNDINRDSYSVTLTSFYAFLKAKTNIKLRELKNILLEIDSQYN